MFSAGFLNYYETMIPFFKLEQLFCICVAIVQLMFEEQIVSYHSQVILREIILEILHSGNLTNTSAHLDKNLDF